MGDPTKQDYSVTDRRASQQPVQPKPHNGILRCSHGNYTPRCPECLKKLEAIAEEINMDDFCKHGRVNGEECKLCQQELEGIERNRKARRANR